MDYLSRKQGSRASSNKTNTGLSKGSTFNVLFNNIFGKLSLDEQVLLGEKFITKDIKSILQDQDLIECINAFFNNNLNISETSRNAFLHRNTLLYRIEKIYKQTGLNIRHFDDAITFKLLLFIYEKTNKRSGNDEK